MSVFVVRVGCLLPSQRQMQEAGPAAKGLDNLKLSHPGGTLHPSWGPSMLKGRYQVTQVNFSIQNEVEAVPRCLFQETIRT